MVLSLRRSADGVSFDSVKNAPRVPVLSLRYERYSLCAPRGIVSALQRYSASDIISFGTPLKISIIVYMLSHYNKLRNTGQRPTQPHDLWPFFLEMA